MQRKLGLAFQHPDDQLFMATVRQDVKFWPRRGDAPQPNPAGIGRA
ncbi:hypothetical protein [Gracilinema caldarium]|nr:hypothetical protein [Gracilinema caldarium]